ncbi:MAG: hypothetical protein ABJB74_16410 [Gemmatimonas sp.]
MRDYGQSHVTPSNIFFGALHPGDGTAWFDALSIEIDGQPYGGDLAGNWRAWDAETGWVREHASKLTTSNPTASLSSDVGPKVG